MRVLVVRPSEGGERTAERLRSLGHEAVAAPVLAIRATAERPPPGSFAATVLTSANAAAFLPTIAADRQLGPVFAVGERTAAAARAEGIEEVRVGAGDAAALARLVAGFVPGRDPLLLVAGRDRKQEPEASLRAVGYPVAVWTAYEAVAASRLPDAAAEALRARTLDAALHYSRRSAATLVALAGHAGLLSPLRKLPNLCLSADVAAPLREAGASRLILADDPDEDSLLKALAAVSFASPPGRSRREGGRC
jgi:uroporphyrinogen-III synthase